jgi:hypothetical protein
VRALKEILIAAMLGMLVGAALEATIEAGSDVYHLLRD